MVNYQQFTFSCYKWLRHLNLSLLNPGLYKFPYFNFVKHLEMNETLRETTNTGFITALYSARNCSLRNHITLQLSVSSWLT
jgi:hypothetical protein